MWQALKKLIAANPMGLFLWSIIGNLYIMIAVASLVVLFWFSKGLEQIGFIRYFTNSTIEILDVSKSIAQNCTTKLGPNFDNLVNFWKCLGDPPKYEVRENQTGEKALESGLNKLVPNKNDEAPKESPTNPYDVSNSINNSGESTVD